MSNKHVVERRFFGVAYTSSTADRSPGEAYEHIFEKPCEHVVRTGGFGRSSAMGIACGITAEGAVLRHRNATIKAVFELEKRLGDVGLALASFQFIDKTLPPTIRIEEARHLPERAQPTLMMLGHLLPLVATVDEWRRVLDAAKSDFSDVSALPQHITKELAE